jgi:energy-coupling factor transport system substrate-specific component
MSWGLAAMLVLGATLFAGFAWYERSRPPSQIVALVAALAAISVAGRVAFSPIPNVVPTTDITLIAGYTLGGAPGFAVGALSGLVSNFWLGQGPWTPWQMAGWGMTGLFGAWLAMLSGRRVNRYGLAAVCAFAGFAYGALLDFSLMVTYGGEQSLDRYLAISARGVPFNIAHAAGNAALALVAGPAMVRMLIRYRRRFEFAWKRGPVATARAGGATAGAACLIAALLVAGTALPGKEADAAGGGPGAGVAWLRAAQNDDGGFGFAPGEDSSQAMTGWSVLGLEAAGINPLDLDHGDATPISYLAGNLGEITTTGDIERTILVLRAAGLDPRHFRGHDLVSGLLARRGKDGSWGGQVNQTAFGIFALRAAGTTSGNGRSAGWLRAHQNSDGGWGFSAGASSDADTTGAVMQGLAASGNAAGIRRGVSYLRGAQRSGGGFPLNGGVINAQSTAYAVQGLVAAGVGPSAVRRGGRSPLDYLASVQAADGHYRYSASSDQTPVWVTAQALLAANGAAFPLSPVPRRAVSAPAPASSAAQGQAKAGSKGQPPKQAGAKGAPASTAAQPSGETAPVALTPASSAADQGGGGGIPAWLIVLAAAAAGAAAVWGGWVLYRRRLPDRPGSQRTNS